MKRKVRLSQYPMTERQFRSFSTIFEMIDLYSRVDTEYYKLVNLLYERYNDYHSMIHKTNVESEQTAFEEFIK